MSRSSARSLKRWLSASTASQCPRRANDAPQAQQAQQAPSLASSGQAPAQTQHHHQQRNQNGNAPFVLRRSERIREQRANQTARRIIKIVDSSPAHPNCGTLDENIATTARLDDLTPIKVILDTGASASLISQELVNALKMTTSPSSPATSFTMADGSRAKSLCVLKIRLRLIPTAPSQPFQLHVVPTLHPQDVILIAVRDLRGYALATAPTPRIEYIIPVLADSSTDIEEPPTASVSSHNDVCAISDDVLTPEQRNLLKEFIHSYRDCFGAVDATPARMEPFRVVLCDNATPASRPPRRLSPEKLEFVQSEVSKLLLLGMIRPSTSSWSAPITVVRKRGGGWRMCIDYSELNKRMLGDSYPLPRIEDLERLFRGCPFLGSFDFSSGFYQAPVSAESIPCLAFATPFGLYEFTRLPFGTKSAPAYFQRQVHRLFGDIPGVTSYQDDLGMFAPTFTAFLNVVRNVLDRCRQAHVMINARKSILGPARLAYLGHLIGPATVEVDPERLQPILNLRHPTNRETLHSFLGFSNYYSRFIPHFAEIAAPLWDLTKRGNAFRWDDELERRFTSIKEALSHPQILSHVDPSCELVLRTDASCQGIGGVLLQIRTQPSGESTEETISFFGRKLTTPSAPMRL